MMDQAIVLVSCVNFIIRCPLIGQNAYVVCLVCAADMAVQNFIGGSFRGATWVALHNGGGVGW